MCRLKSRRSAARPDCSSADSFSIPSLYARWLPFQVLVSTQPTDVANMTKRKLRADAPDPSQNVSAPSSAKKAKNRPSRVAAQRARSALQEEAKPEIPCDLSEDEVLRMLSAKNRRKSASSAKQASNTPSTKRSGTVPAAKACGPEREVKNSSSSASLNSSYDTETVDLSGPSTPSVRSGGTPSKKRAARPKQKDSAIGDYFHASSRPNKSGARIPPPQSSGRSKERSPAQNCVQVLSDTDQCSDRPSTGDTTSNVAASQIGARPVPTDDILEEPSDEDEPRGTGSTKQSGLDTNEDEDSEDDIPEDFGPRKGRSTVVKAEGVGGGSESVCGDGKEVHSSASSPAIKGKTTASIPILEVSDNDDNQSAPAKDEFREEDDNSVNDAVLKCLAKLLTRSGVQESRTRTIFKEINSMSSTLDDVLFRVMTVESHLKDVRANNVGSNSTGTGKRGSKKSEGGIAGWERIMTEKFRYIDCYFPPAMWKEAILHSAFEHIYNSTSSKWGREECIIALSGVLFARKNHGKKSLFETEIGKSASAFRKLILEKLLHLAREGKYPVVAPRSGVSLDPKPEWLGKYGEEMYIGKEHIKAGQLYHESKASNTPEYNRRISVGNGAEPNRKDYASFVMIHLYDIMNHLFIERRKRVRSAFCECFGYLFHQWSKVKDVHVNDDNLRLAWKVPFDEIVKAPDESLRDAETKDNNGVSADKANNIIFDFVARKKELWLFVAHDVIMARGVHGADGKRRIPGTERDVPKLYRRWMNMLAPACEFFMALAGVDDDEAPHQIMRFHSCSTRVLYHVGLFLRDVYNLHQSRDILDGFANGARKITVPKKQWDNILDFFDIFNSSDGGNDKAVVNATCAVFEEEYNANHKLTKAERLARAREEAGSDKTGPGEGVSRDESEKNEQESGATPHATKQSERESPGSPSDGKAPTISTDGSGTRGTTEKTDGDDHDVDDDAIARAVHARVGTLQLDDAVDDDGEQLESNVGKDNDNARRSHGDDDQHGERPRVEPINALIVPDTRVTKEK